jgi:hypothetical protein
MRLPLDLSEPAILIRIPRVYQPGMPPAELYDATRGIWRVAERREAARYGLAVYDGAVIEAYEIREWHKAGTTPYVARKFTPELLKGRWEFTGVLAPQSIREQVIGRSVAPLFARGNQNPILYLNC